MSKLFWVHSLKMIFNGGICCFPVGVGKEWARFIEEMKGIITFPFIIGPFEVCDYVYNVESLR